jgi:TPR repeat protein
MRRFFPSAPVVVELAASCALALPLCFQAQNRSLAAPSQKYEAPAAQQPPRQDGPFSQIIAIRHSASPGRLRIFVQTSRGIKFEPGAAQSPDRIFFDLRATVPGAVSRSIDLGDSVVRRLRIAEYQPGVTRLVIDLAKPAPFATYTMTNPPGLVIEVLLSAVNSEPSASPAGDNAKPAQGSTILTPPIEPGPQLARRSDRLPNLPGSVKMAIEASPAAETKSRPPLQVTADSAGITAAKSVGRPSEPTRAGPSTPSCVESNPAAGVGTGSARESDLHAAEQGSAEAQFRLGNFYVAHDCSEAAKWYLRAAQQGHAIAASNLGVLYAHGWGVKQSDTEAVEFFRAAAEKGNAGGQSNLGAMYVSGRGVSQNDAEGAKWLQKAAEQQVAEAEYSLGTLYANGRGVPHDDSAAAKWFRRAAEQGYAPARVALGKMYANGSGVPQDPAVALQWFRGTATAEAYYQLGLAYQQGRGTTANQSEAISWFLRAAQLRSPEAQYALGQIFRDRDAVAAYSWFAIAAANGHKDALTAINALASSMTAQQIAQAQQQALSLAKRPDSH